MDQKIEKYFLFLCILLFLTKIQGPMLKKYQDNSSDDDQEIPHAQNDDDLSSSINEEPNSQPVVLEQDVDFFQMHGMYFCGICKNLMQPTSTKSEILGFRCRRCGIKNINFKNRIGEKCLIYSKSLQQNSKKTENNPKLMLDPSMPRMIIECPECSYHEAVYTMAAEEGERRIVLRMICARGAEEKVMKCGKTWDLQQDTEIEDSLQEGILSLK